MESIITEITEKLQNGLLTKDEADKSLIKLFKVKPKITIRYEEIPGCYAHSQEFKLDEIVSVIKRFTILSIKWSKK